MIKIIESTKKVKKQEKKCWDCKYRDEVVGSCHSSCKHPQPKRINIQCFKRGIEGGWFAFPCNFDPTWLITCDGFEEASNV